MKRAVAAVPVVLFFAAAAVVGCFRLIDTDLWLYLRVGERICGTLAPPRLDVFSFSAAGRPWVDVHWLAQAALWLAFRAGGATGLCLLRLALVVALFAVLYRCCRRVAPPPLVCGVLTLSLLVSSDGFLMKPHLFALLFAAVFVAALERPDRAHWPLVPLQALWVNVHPSFLVGPLLVFVYWADARMKPGRGRSPSPALLGACLLACLASPYGLATLAQPFLQVGTRLYGDVVIPWTPPSSAFPAPASYLWFKAMLALCLLGFALNPRGVRPAHLAVVLLFAALSFRSRRHLALFGVLAAPGLSYALAGLAAGLRARAPRLSRAAAAACAPLLCAALLLLIRDVVSGEFYFRQRSLKRFGLGASEIAYPDAAVAFLDAAGVGGRLFCTYDIGSYVAGRMHPRASVFIDGRNLVYGEALLRRYLDAMGSVDSLSALAAEHGVDALLLSHTARDARALLPSLVRDGRWRPVHLDDRSIVFLPAGSRPGIPTVDLSACATPGVPSAGPFPLAELRLGEFHFTRGGRECARRLFRAALARRRDLPEARNFLGVIAAQDGDAAAAEAEFREACALSRRYAEPRVNLSEMLRLRGETAGAEREARRARRIAPSNPHAREALGLALLLRGDLDGAERELEKAVALSPSAGRHSNLGTLRERAGDPEGAAEEYEKALRADPGHAPARRNLDALRARGKANKP